MTDTTATVTAPEPRTGSGAGRFSSPLRTAPKPVREAARYAGAAPFLAYVFIFLILPLIWIVRDAFLHSNTGAFTWSNLDIAVHGVYLKGFEQENLTVVPSVTGNGIVTVRTFLGAVTRLAVRLSGDTEVVVDVATSAASDMTPGTAVEVGLPATPVLIAHRES
jgi:hypothetical protein